MRSPLRARALRAVCLGGAVAALGLPAGVAAAQAPPWSDPSLAPDTRADLLEQAMTPEEKAELMSNDLGTPWAYSDAGIPRLGIPSLRMLDAGSGLRLGSLLSGGGDGGGGGGSGGGPGNGQATAMPSTMPLAAAFDRRLAALYGRTVAQEVHEVGGNVLLGPNGDIVRTPWWGRANETESEDPLLTSRIVGAYVRGAEGERVLTDLKHYDVYTQGSTATSPTTAGWTSGRSRRSTSRPGRPRSATG